MTPWSRTLRRRSAGRKDRSLWRRAISLALGLPLLGPMSCPCGVAAAEAGFERSDSFDEKLRLLEDAWRRHDYRVARALTHSLRSTVIETQAAEESPGNPLVPSGTFQRVDVLPAGWRQWAAGWHFAKPVRVVETNGLDRVAEPVEVLLGFQADHAALLAREVRVARVEAGGLREIPSQVHTELRRGAERFCSVIFLADVAANHTQDYWVFTGNPDAELPDYPGDLKTRGEGVALDVENEVYTAMLSRQTGQLERIILKREHGLELFSGGQGHGEPPGIDWAHDYVDADNFQKLRISLWESCPDYEVIRGPVCTIVRRWGFPHSPVHPLFTPSRLHIYVEYRFYAGLPWFHKFGSMQALKDFEAAAMRDDEWVFSGQSFTDTAWMGPDGKVHLGEVDPERREDLWGVGFVNRQTHDSFFGLFLDHRAEGLPPLKHTGSPMLYYKWHGNVWSRYPLPGRKVPAGARILQKNAYVMLPFQEPGGAAGVEALRERLIHPVGVIPGPLSPEASPGPGSAGRLARPGEAGDAPVSKRALWEALADCKDAQLYTADASVVDLGLVQDIRVRGDVVTVILTMPHRGRPLAGYFAHGSISVHPTPSYTIEDRLRRVPGVGKVVVEQRWDPPWDVNRLTDAGRRKMGL